MRFGDPTRTLFTIIWEKKPMTMKTLSLAAYLLTSMFTVAMAQDADWVSLLDGKSLDNWTRKNGTATYRIDGNAITGKTATGSPNSFLCTNKEYGDFVLRFEVKVDNELNSGVQIRSKTKEPIQGPIACRFYGADGKQTLTLWRASSTGRNGIRKYVVGGDRLKRIINHSRCCLRSISMAVDTG